MRRPHPLPSAHGRRCAAILILLAGVGSSCAPSPARATDLDSLLAALSDTQPLIDLRVRSEIQHQSGFSREAQALLLRSRLGLRTGSFWSTSFLAEGSFLTPLVDDYNSGLNGKTGYPSISDPRNYELHRLQLENTSLPGTDLVLGRQRVALDDQRFVGSSNWRMNENTLDSVRLIGTRFAHLTLDLTYFDKFHRRTTHASSRLGTLSGDSYLANVRYDTPWARLTAFDYLVSFKETPTLSSRTHGVRVAGEQPIGVITLGYIGSWATQSDYADNPVRYHNDYHLAELTGTFRQYSLSVGTERLGGNGTIGLSTPMASFHSWDGWAGAFTTTPANGLDAKYSKVGYSVKNIGPLQTLLATATYYDFRSDRLSQHYGSELDLQLQAGWQRFMGLLELSDYASANAPTTHSTRNFWVELDYVL